MNKDRKPRDLIYHLQIPGSTPIGYKRDSRRMAQLTKDFHNQLQNKDITLSDDNPEFDRKIEESLGEVPAAQCLINEEVLNTDWSPCYAQVGEAL